MHAVATTAEPSLLMVGNSFTDENNLEEMVQALLEEDGRLGGKVYAMRFMRGASTFAEHANSAELKSMIAERRWSWVVLQEQSEKPGFWDTAYESELKESYEALNVLDSWVREAKAETILMMTWARLNEDPYNPDIFPDFTTMQDRVATGYYRMQAQISTIERPVKIAPVGLAFQAIHDSVKDRDPTESGTDFFNLYQEDTIHPSVQGSYLAACVIYATITGRDPSRLRYRPMVMQKEQADKLQAAAQATVVKFNRENEFNKQASSREPERASDKGAYVPKEQQDSGGPNSHTHVLLIVAGCVALLGWVKFGRKTKVPRSPPPGVDMAESIEFTDLNPTADGGRTNWT